MVHIKKYISVLGYPWWHWHFRSNLQLIHYYHWCRFDLSSGLRQILNHWSLYSEIEQFFGHFLCNLRRGYQHKLNSILHSFQLFKRLKFIKVLLAIHLSKTLQSFSKLKIIGRKNVHPNSRKFIVYLLIIFLATYMILMIHFDQLVSERALWHCTIRVKIYR